MSVLFRAALAALALSAFALGTLDGGGQGRVDIRGSIKKVTPTPKASEKGALLGSLLIEGPKDAGTSHDKASVRVTAATKIYKGAGGARKPAMFSDLKEGLTVEATFTGPVAESYPVQATAGEIVILPGLAKN